MDEPTLRALFYGSEGGQTSATVELLTARAGELQAGWTPETLDEYLPNRTKWSRLVDPAQNNQDIFDRLDPAGVSNLADGAKYSGEMKSGKPHTKGRGRYEFSTFVYEGGFKDGQPDGEGWIRGHEKSGKASGSSYDGKWVNGYKHGKGELKVLGGKVKLSGDFASDLPSGPDNTIVVNESAVSKDLPMTQYRGGMKDGQLYSTDAYIEFPGGVAYKGSVQNSLRHGKGVITDGDQVVFDGQWKDDLPHGRVSRMVLDGGLMYSGDVLKGKRQGHGELFKADGTILYEGLWLNDVPSGRGSAFTEDGQYEGEFKDGKRHGKGNFQYSDQLTDGRHRTYEGDWANDLPNGVGRYLDEEGTEATYKFEHGVMDEASRNQYKAMCGSLPKNLSDQKVKPLNIKGMEDKYWGNGISLSEDMLNKATVSVDGIWRGYLSAKFSFVPPDTEAKPASLSSKVSKRSTDRVGKKGTQEPLTDRGGKKATREPVKDRVSKKATQEPLKNPSLLAG
eukprot:GHVQ01008374.1.p1 GENE.GHVQ01008374.1~~GHVQ01008374.1.p1  ORF type:complete len:553 (+),score=63.73 GHVQ01008374.1:143-1660(+)